MNLKKIGLVVFSIIFIASSNIKADIDYSKDESYYQKLCAKRSGYNANKNVCQGYEAYLKQQRKNIDQSTVNIKEQIEQTKGDITKLIKVIQENQKLIDSKEVLIKKTEEDIKEKQKQIAELEVEVAERLSLMQEINSENFILDFLMSSVSLDDLVTKMDGINAINTSNQEIITDLDFAKQALDKEQKKLKNEQKELTEAKKEQNQMLTDYRSKEADLFVKLEAERKRKAQYNKQLDSINIEGIANSKGFIKPVSHATVTAVSWYYPASFGGGWHPGIDLANNSGTPILSPANGVVLMRGSDGGGGYGNYMITAHQVGRDTYTFLYGHMTHSNNLSKISQGQTIGYMGSTGNSTGPHVHYEVFKHKGKSLSKVVNEYKSNFDIYFGLGYSGTGSCSNTCRIKPHEFLGVKYGQVF